MSIDTMDLYNKGGKSAHEIILHISLILHVWNILLFMKLYARTMKKIFVFSETSYVIMHRFPSESMVCDLFATTMTYQLHENIALI